MCAHLEAMGRYLLQTESGTTDIKTPPKARRKRQDLQCRPIEIVGLRFLAFREVALAVLPFHPECSLTSGLHRMYDCHVVISEYVMV